jgi:hypothetical protein
VGGWEGGGARVAGMGRRGVRLRGKLQIRAKLLKLGNMCTQVREFVDENGH